MLICILWQHYSKLALHKFQKNLLILQWSFRHFCNCMDNEEETLSKIQRIKPTVICHIFLFWFNVVASCVINVMRRQRLNSVQLARKWFHRRTWGYWFRIHWLNFQLVWTCVLREAVSELSEVSWIYTGAGSHLLSKGLDNLSYPSPCFRCISGKKQYIKRAFNWMCQSTNCS